MSERPNLNPEKAVGAIFEGLSDADELTARLDSLDDARQRPPDWCVELPHGSAPALMARGLVRTRNRWAEAAISDGSAESKREEADMKLDLMDYFQRTHQPRVEAGILSPNDAITLQTAIIAGAIVNGEAPFERYDVERFMPFLQEVRAAYRNLYAPQRTDPPSH